MKAESATLSSLTCLGKGEAGCLLQTQYIIVQNAALLLSSNIKSQPQLDDARLDRNIHPAPGNGDVLSTVHSLSDRSQVGKYGASGSGARVF